MKYAHFRKFTGANGRLSAEEYKVVEEHFIEDKELLRAECEDWAENVNQEGNHEYHYDFEIVDKLSPSWIREEIKKLERKRNDLTYKILELNDLL